MRTPESVVADNNRDRKLTSPDPFIYEWTHEGTEYRIEIPAGFEYRPTTTPLPRPLIELIWGRYALEDTSLPHDYVYKHKRHWEDGKLVTDRRVPKAAADRIFLEEEDQPVLRHLAYGMSMTIGWAIWWDWHEKAAAIFSNPFTS